MDIVSLLPLLCVHYTLVFCVHLCFHCLSNSFPLSSNISLGYIMGRFLMLERLRCRYEKTTRIDKVKLQSTCNVMFGYLVDHPVMRYSDTMSHGSALLYFLEIFFSELD